MLLLHFGSFLCWKGKLVKTCCHWISVQLLYNLASFNLISPFPLRILKNGFLTAAPPVRPFLMRLKPTANRWINWRASCISSLMSGLCWISYFLKDMTVRHSICFFFLFFKKACNVFFCPPLVQFPFWWHAAPPSPKKRAKNTLFCISVLYIPRKSLNVNSGLFLQWVVMYREEMCGGLRLLHTTVAIYKLLWSVISASYFV